MKKKQEYHLLIPSNSNRFTIPFRSFKPPLATISLAETFTRMRQQKKVASLPYITAGDPDLSTTAEALKVLNSCGSDIIELGVPYSDPLANGPVIQAAAATRSLIPYITAGDPDLSTTAEALKVLDSCGPDIIELGVPYSDPLANGHVIQAAAARRSFIPYITAGDPDLSTIAKALKVLDSCGTDIIELGVPYSDPLADGPVIQIIKDEDLEDLRELGSGTFGTVFQGKWRGADVAIKRMKKRCFTGCSSEQERLTVDFLREADVLSKLRHPNVLAFYGVVQDGPGGTLATVTEFMVNGSLRHVLLCKNRPLDHRKRLIIAMDAALGMEYLHAKNIVHFDLKCDNLLVNLKDPLRPICKVGDFGLSKIKRNTLVTGGVRGTLPWMAPELFSGSKVSEKIDVFSFGIVLWEILTGEEPYANMDYGAILGGIVNYTLRPPVPTYCDHEWRLLMEQCWAQDPVARPSFTEIARRLRIMSAAC